nr:GNAT family N-acetyltransferase [Maliibacterium massiliense]
MQLTFRAYRKQDFDMLVGLIRKTWHYDAFSSPKTAAKLARVFLSSCLANHTFSRVALRDEKPVGIILGKDIAAYKCPFGARLKQLWAILSLLLSREGRRVSKIFGNVSGVDKALLEDCGKAYPAELVLFAVDPACRGEGIGKMLFQSFLDYMRAQRLKEFYLFTDTSCNYGFYEHQGMTRRQEQTRVFTINGQPAEMHFFIYDGHSAPAGAGV